MIITETMLHDASCEIEALLISKVLDAENKERLRVLRKRLAHSRDNNKHLADGLFSITFPIVEDAKVALSEAHAVRQLKRIDEKKKRSEKAKPRVKNAGSPKRKAKPKAAKKSAKPKAAK